MVWIIVLGVLILFSTVAFAYRKRLAWDPPCGRSWTGCSDESRVLRALRIWRTGASGWTKGIKRLGGMDRAVALNASWRYFRCGPTAMREQV